jgi:hypothetical protein
MTSVAARGDGGWQADATTPGAIADQLCYVERDLSGEHLHAARGGDAEPEGGLMPTRRKSTPDPIDTHMVDTLIVAVGFFANCPDDLLDPDVAVRKLEEIAGCLRGMTKSARSALKRHIASRAYQASSLEAREFLITMCENLAL